MVDITDEVTYPFDPTGKAATNKVPTERHVLTSVNWTDYNIVIPRCAPFFAESMTSVRHYPSGRELMRGVDWIETWYFDAAANEIGARIYGGILIYDHDLTGEIELGSYQTLGGDWVLDGQRLAKLLASKLTNPVTTRWEQVTDLPYAFPPLDHEHDIQDLSTLQTLLDKLEEIAKAISYKSGGSLDQHLSDFNNPHKTDKAQVGLPLVDNYATATDKDVVASGWATNKFATPAVIAGLIQLLVGKALTAHMADTSNPHKTDKNSVQLGNVDNFKTAGAKDIIKGQTATDKFVTPNIVEAMIESLANGALSDHMKDFSNPHRTNKNDVNLGNVDNFKTASLADITAGVYAADAFLTPQVANAMMQLQSPTSTSDYYPAVTPADFPKECWTHIANIEPSTVTVSSALMVYGGNDSGSGAASVVQVLVNRFNAAASRVVQMMGTKTDSTFHVVTDSSSGQVQLWMKSLNNRAAVVVTSPNLQMVNLDTSGKATPTAPAGATQITDVTSYTRSSDLKKAMDDAANTYATQDSVTAVNKKFADYALKTDLQPLATDEDLSTFADNVSKTYATKETLKSYATTDQLSAVSGQQSVTIAREVFTLAKAGTRQYDMKTLVGANFAKYDLVNPRVTLRVKDSDTTSTTTGMYIGADAVSVTAVNGNSLVVTNLADSSMDFTIRVDLQPLPAS